MKIPQYEPLHNRELLKEMMNEYLSGNGWMTEHEVTQELETKIASLLGVNYCHMVNNGTISLSLALLASGVKAGDNVFVPSISMIATANAVRFIGAQPCFVDIDDSLCMDYVGCLDRIKQYNPKAVLFVSLNGRCGAGESIRGFCEKHKIAFIEDAAQSFGSITTNAKIKSYSFSMPKIISMGQGGCLTTNNEEISRTIKHLKDFGRESGGNDCHDFFGINCKITDLQAIVGLEQLNNIDWRIQRKKEIYNLYHKELQGYTEVIKTDLSQTVPWFIEFFARSEKERDMLTSYLKGAGIQTRNIYPPMYTQKIYNQVQPGQSGIINYYPNTEKYINRGFWLPSSFTLTNEDIILVCNKVKEFYK